MCDRIFDEEAGYPASKITSRVVSATGPAPCSAGEVQCDGSPGGVQLAEPDHGAIRWEALDLDPALAQTLQRGGVGAHLRRRPHPHDQPLGELIENVLEILEHQRVPVATPPVPYDPAGHHDQVARLRLSFHHEATEPVVLDPRHVLMILRGPDPRHSLAVPCRVGQQSLVIRDQIGQLLGQPVPVTW